MSSISKSHSKACKFEQCHTRRHRLHLPPAVRRVPSPVVASSLPCTTSPDYLMGNKQHSTCGVLSSIIACVQRHNSRPRSPLVKIATGGGGRSGSSGSSGASGRKSVVILPRDAHKSAVHALVLSGATPCFLPPIRHPKSGVSLGVGTAALEAALQEYGDEVSV